MNVTLNLIKNQTVSGIDEDNIVTIFDASKEHHGEGNGPSPMVVMLESMAACTFIDVLTMLRKKRKTINDFKILVTAERAEVHPRVFTKVHLHFVLSSPDTNIADLEKSVELSQTKYCGASAMFQRSGCEVSWESEVKN